MSEDDTAWDNFARLRGRLAVFRHAGLTRGRTQSHLDHAILSLGQPVSMSFIASLSELTGTDSERVTHCSRAGSTASIRRGPMRSGSEPVRRWRWSHLPSSTARRCRPPWASLSAGAIQSVLVRTWHDKQRKRIDRARVLRSHRRSWICRSSRMHCHCRRSFRSSTLSARMLDQRVSDLPLLPGDHQAVIGTLACMGSGSDSVFYLRSNCGSKLSVECRRWIEQVLASRFIFVVHRAAEYCPRRRGRRQLC